MSVVWLDTPRDILRSLLRTVWPPPGEDTGYACCGSLHPGQRFVYARVMNCIASWGRVLLTSDDGTLARIGCLDGCSAWDIGCTSSWWRPLPRELFSR